MPAQIILIIGIMMDLFNILKDVPDVYAMRGDYLIFHACLPKAKALRKET